MAHISSTNPLECNHRARSAATATAIPTTSYFTKQPKYTSSLPILSLLLLLLLLLAFSYSNVNLAISISQLKSLLQARPTPSATLCHSSPTRLLIKKSTEGRKRMKNRFDIGSSKIAICLVGSARHFELTGPSIIKNVLQEYPVADLFLHSPLDKDSYKFLLLAAAPKVAAVRIFSPQPFSQTEAQSRVLTSNGSPHGIQGLLQYFNLVEGCLTMIKSHESRRNFNYEWIMRTRVDGYWSAPLSPQTFKPGFYVVPKGSRYHGLNDRLGVGDRATSLVALSRLSIISELDAIGYRQLNSESAFKAQLEVGGAGWMEMKMPFCVVTERQYAYPPTENDVPVASMGSQGPLSGAKCRPCTPACGVGMCVERVMKELDEEWSWTEWRNGSLELCDGRSGWEEGWEWMFDGVAGEEGAAERRRMAELDEPACVGGFDVLRARAAEWDAPPAAEICRLGVVRMGSHVGVDGQRRPR